MQAAEALRGARRRARIAQRELATRAGVPYSTVARIESGAVTPRVDTMDRLLRVCGEALEARPRRGLGVDRTLIIEHLGRTPAERVAFIVDAANRIRATREAAQPAVA